MSALLAPFATLLLATRVVHPAPSPAPPIDKAQRTPPPLREVVTVPVVRTAAEERFSVSATSLVIDALGRTIDLDGDPQRLARQLTTSKICPKVRARKGGVTLLCTSAQLEAGLSRGTLVVRQTLGPPEGKGFASWGFHSFADALKIDCTRGDLLPLDNAECAIARGDKKAASDLLTRVLDVRHKRARAAVRLGDIARAAKVYDVAMGYYLAAGRKGPWARLAILRVCELRGTCLEVGRMARGLHPLDAAVLPTALEREMILRGARVYAFAGKLKEAIDRLAPYGKRADHICVGRELLCQRIVLAALDEGDDDARAGALAFYLTVGDRFATPVSLRLAHAVALEAERLRAPAFGAAILAGASRLVDEDARPGHLLKTAALYVRAGDRARAELVLDYLDQLRLEPSDRAAATSTRAELARVGAVISDVPSDEEERAKAILARHRARR